MSTKRRRRNISTNTGSNKWKLEGYDTFEGSYYPLEGEYDSEAQAEDAARSRLIHLEKTQPSSSSGGQGGIQDRVYIVNPEGKLRLFTNHVQASAKKLCESCGTGNVDIEEFKREAQEALSLLESQPGLTGQHELLRVHLLRIHQITEPACDK